MEQQNDKDKNPRKKIKVIRINLSWLYIPLILVIIGMLFTNRGVPAQKIEWAQVRQGVTAVEQEALIGGDIQAGLDALQAEVEAAAAKG